MFWKKVFWTDFKENSVPWNQKSFSNILKVYKVQKELQLPQYFLKFFSTLWNSKKWTSCSNLSQHALIRLEYLANLASIIKQI